jgi:hypothetical protein
MKKNLGILLILASFIPWILLPVAAWLAPSTGAKGAWSGGLVILGEALFWPGLLLAGKETWKIAKARGWKGVIPELLSRLRNPKTPPPREPSA